jgi:hypothetical protein
MSLRSRGRVLFLLAASHSRKSLHHRSRARRIRVKNRFAQRAHRIIVVATEELVMRRCDVAVVGLGLMGSAALDALLTAKVDALGFDPLPPGADRGSSHGSCRVFRRFNFENPNYTGLSDQAHAGWKRLEAASGEPLLIPCPVLEAGLPGSSMVAASRAAAIAQGRPDPARTAAEINRQFPAFALPADWDAVVQDGGAILKAETALRIMRTRAGERVIAEASQIAEGDPTSRRLVQARPAGDRHPGPLPDLHSRSRDQQHRLRLSGFRAARRQGGPAQSWAGGRRR